MFEQYKGKLVTIPMSGGADSTLLCIEALRAGCKVEALRISCNTPTRHYEQLYAPALDAALDKLASKHGTYYSVKRHEIKIEPDRNAAYCQLSWWLSVIPFKMHPDSVAVAMGWNASDGMYERVEACRNAIAGIRGAAYHSTPDVIFPLIHMAKTQVLIAIRDYQLPDIASNIWWCDGGSTWRVHVDPLVKSAGLIVAPEREIHQCGKCHSCADSIELFTDQQGRYRRSYDFKPMGKRPDWAETFRPIRISRHIREVCVQAIGEQFYPDITPSDTMPNERAYRMHHHHGEISCYGEPGDVVGELDANQILIERRRGSSQHHRLLTISLARLMIGYFNRANDLGAADELIAIQKYLDENMDEMFPVPDWVGHPKPVEQLKEEVVLVWS